MNKFHKISVLAAGSVFLCSCAATSPDDKIDYSRGSSAVSPAEKAMEMKLVKLTNELRAKKGLKPVKYHGGLSKMAREHSDFMSRNSGKFKVEASTITHFGFEARSAAASREYDVNSMGENVVSTTVKPNTAEEMMRAWIKSPVHYNVLTGTTFRYIGTGTRDSGSRVHGTLLMAAPAIGKLPKYVGPQGF